MAKAIKTFAVNTTTSITIYTVPANTSAKVIVSSFSIASSCSLTFGSASITSSGGILLFNQGIYTTSPFVQSNLPLEYFLAAGQTVTVVSSGGLVTAQICVIEEAS